MNNKHLPNILTISRIIIIPLVLITISLEGKIWHQISAALFILAGITDFLDGYLARHWKVQSKLGRFLDPIADKLLIASTIMLLVYFDRAHVIPAIAIVCREILVSGLREFLAEINVSVPVTQLAKIKTALQITSIVMLLLGTKGSGFEFVDPLGHIFFWAAAGLTLFTGYAYLKAGLKHMD